MDQPGLPYDPGLSSYPLHKAVTTCGGTTTEEVKLFLNESQNVSSTSFRHSQRLLTTLNLKSASTLEAFPNPVEPNFIPAHPLPLLSSPTNLPGRP